MFEQLKTVLQPVFLLFGVVVGTVLLWERRERLHHTALWQSILTAVLFTLFSFCAALLFADFEMLLGGGGENGNSVSTYGVYLFAAPVILAVAALFKLDGKAYLDAFAIYAIPSLFLMRVNCVVQGCCIGTRIFATQLRWPTRESELVFFVLVFLLLLRMERKPNIPGSLFPVLMVSYGAFRFINEWFRVGQPLFAGMHLSHIWSVICLIIGLSIYSEFKSRAARTAKKARALHRRK